ncbi:MAG: DUF89 family protein [Actinobacteria bacterium]|nr:DUF89 family protein [Actinomycetota bacterium]
MKTCFECIPCIINQAILTLNLCNTDSITKRKVLQDLLKNLENIDYDLSPSENTDTAYDLISKYTGIKDPYSSLKKRHNEMALKIYPELEKILDKGKDSLYTAAKIAIAGNIIDMGISSSHSSQLDFNKIMENIKNISLAIDDFTDFKDILMSSDNILYMADNAGEIVFDKIFITQILKLDKNVKVSVKSGPVINDANKEDAVQAGIDKITEVLETGHNKIGNNPKYMSNAFLNEFKKADLIICKGQGNFETLDNTEAPVFFLLKAKCNCIADELGVNYLDIVFKKSDSFKDKK